MIEYLNQLENNLKHIENEKKKLKVEFNYEQRVKKENKNSF